MQFRWYDIARFSSIIPIASFLLWFSSPESPIFYMRKKKVALAEKSVKKLYGARYNVEEEILRIRVGLEWTAEKKPHNSWWEKSMNIVKRPDLYKPFMIIVCMLFLQQFSGISIIRSYVVVIFNEIFHDSNFDRHHNTSHHNFTAEDPLGGERDHNSSVIVTGCDSDEKTASEAYLAAIVIAIIRFLSSVLLSRLLVNHGRRKLYMMSASLTVLALVCFATCNVLLFYEDAIKIGGDDTLIVAVKWSSVITIGLFMFAVQLGVYTLPTLLSGELFPSDVRAFCKSLSLCMQSVFLVINLKVTELCFG